MPEECAVCIIAQKIPGPTFLKLGPDAMIEGIVSLLVPVISSNIQTFEAELWPNIFERLPLILLFWKLKDSLSVSRVTTLVIL
jgi:hypothetical protein